jgi:hypothetical protein
MSELEEDQYREFLSGYERRLAEYKEYLLLQRNNKHVVILEALDGRINEELIQDHCNKMISRKKDIDFEFTVLIRLLYLLDDCPIDPSVKQRIAGNIARCFADFPFWPRKDGLHDMSSQVFWSENHIFMFLTGAHLFKQWFADHPHIIEKALASEFEEALLQIYLSAHVKFEGFHECCSHVYFPYTLSALLNLIDFSKNRQVVENAEILVDLLLEQIFYCTSDHGVATLSASARSFPRTRQRIHGHNINQLVRLVTGSSPDNYSATALSGVLATVKKWKPSVICMRACKRLDFMKFKRSPAKEDIRNYYRNSAKSQSSSSFFDHPVHIDDEDITPFYWSAGLITDPDYLSITRSYMSSRRLTKNVQLHPLSFLPSSFMETLMSNYSHLSCGQSYCGIELTVYKRPGGLVLSSLQMFNCSRAGFQQLPWIANLDGVAIWSQSGKGGESVFGFALTNTHNPYIVQSYNVAVIAYSA